MVHVLILRETDMVRGQFGGSGPGGASVAQPACPIGQGAQFALAHGPAAGPFASGSGPRVGPHGFGVPAHDAPGQGSPGFQGLLDIGEAFRFTLSDGTVTAASMLLPSGAARDLMLAGTASYAAANGDVLATQAILAGLSQVRYGDADGDGLYAVIGTARVLTAAPHLNVFGVPGRETLAVTIADGAVSGVSQMYPNGGETVLLSATVVPPSASWTVETGLVVERHTLADGNTSWEVFRDGNGDGLYTEVANGTGVLVELAGVVALTDPVATLL
jgi:hypothetical protein